MEQVAAEHTEAQRLMLARIAAAPETWRARATSAGGFLGAAAAVSFWGLSSQAADLSETTKVIAGVAATLYVISVVAFLAGSVWPSPDADDGDPQDFTAEVHAYATKESRPIKRLVLGGAVAAGCAILATVTCSFIVLTQPYNKTASVAVRSAEGWATVSRLCPKLKNPFPAQVSEGGLGYLKLTIPSSECGTPDSRAILILKAEITFTETAAGS